MTILTLDMPIGRLISKRAAISPDIEALVEMETGRRVTYRAVESTARARSMQFLALGVRKGDRVALLAKNGIDFVVTFFALAKLGAIVVPLNWRLVAEELTYILRTSTCSTIVFAPEFSTQAAACHAALSNVVAHWICLDDMDVLPSFCRGFPPQDPADAEVGPTVPIAGDDPLFIMFTSGTTGRPKGVVHTHASTLGAMITSAPTADIRQSDRFLIASPMFHVGALAPSLHTLYMGGTVVIHSQFDPERIWATIREESVTVAIGVPSMLQFMLEQYQDDPAAVSSLRAVICGGAPVPLDLIDAYGRRGVSIYQSYGLTESGGPTCLLDAAHARSHAGSTGRPYLHTEVKIVRETGELCSPMEAGEICVKGPHVMAGYWNDPEATTNAIRDGWLHTGDIAVSDTDGFIYIKGRIKDMIISGGENIYPAEVEAAILAHPQVADVAVVGVPSAKWGESPVAFVVAKDDSLHESDIVAHCRGRIAAYKLPKAVCFIESLPRGATGKVPKAALRSRYLETAPNGLP